jgi:hypothetical protein
VDQEAEQSEADHGARARPALRTKISPPRRSPLAERGLPPAERGLLLRGLWVIGAPVETWATIFPNSHAEPFGDKTASGARTTAASMLSRALRPHGTKA